MKTLQKQKRNRSMQNTTNNIQYVGILSISACAAAFFFIDFIECNGMVIKITYTLSAMLYATLLFAKKILANCYAKKRRNNFFFCCLLFCACMIDHSRTCAYTFNRQHSKFSFFLRSHFFLLKFLSRNKKYLRRIKKKSPIGLLYTLIAFEVCTS